MEQHTRDILSQVFTSGQIGVLMDPTKKRMVLSSDDIANAISLRCVSPKASRYLRNVMKIPLPGLSTLRKWADKICFYQNVSINYQAQNCTVLKRRFKIVSNYFLFSSKYNDLSA